MFCTSVRHEVLLMYRTIGLTRRIQPLQIQNHLCGRGPRSMHVQCISFIFGALLPLQFSNNYLLAAVKYKQLKMIAQIICAALDFTLDAEYGSQNFDWSKKVNIYSASINQELTEQAFDNNGVYSVVSKLFKSGLIFKGNSKIFGCLFCYCHHLQEMTKNSKF